MACPRRRTGSRTAWFASLAIILGLIAMDGPALAGATSVPVLPSVGTFFEYDYDINLNGGLGNYSGYTESETSHYRYSVTAVAGPNVSMYGSGSWSWSNNTGSSESGSWAENFAFSDVTRLYTQGFDVLGTYARPSVWFWLPTPLTVGEPIRILDDGNFTVQSLSTTLWVGFPPVPRVGALLVSHSAYHRQDVYGSFTATYTDEYLFDPDNGFLLAEVRNEVDSDGTNGFNYGETVTVTSASYPLALDLTAFLAVYAGIPGVVSFALVGTLWFYRGPRFVSVPRPTGSTRVVVRRLRRPLRAVGIEVAITSQFAPYLPAILRRNAALRRPVYTAVAGGQLVGLLTYDKRSKLSTVYANDPSVARLLVQMRRAKNFILDGPLWEGAPVPKPVDSFVVYELAPPAPVPYDPGLVQAMTAEKLVAVRRLVIDTYPNGDPGWALADFADGDLGFVATDAAGSVIGFAFASLAGDEALLHSATVHYRERGLGVVRALMAARLNALATLGVRRVLVEVSPHNLPSTRLVREFGFHPIGQTTYYTRRPKRVNPVDQRTL